MYPSILIFIIIACLMAIAYIFLKNLPKVKAISSSTPSVVRQVQIKRKLLEERLGRHMKTGWAGALVILRPLGKQLAGQFRLWFKKLTELEAKYRTESVKTSFQDKVDQEQYLNQMLLEAEALAKEENYFEAEKKYIEALTLDQKNVSAYKGLGKLYLLKKDYEHARETFEFLLSLNDQDASVHWSLGAIATEKGDLKRAREELQKSLELDSANIASYLDLAQVYLNLEEKEKAFEIVSRAAGLEPNNPRVLDFLIEVSIIVQDKGAALKAYSQLKAANPDNQKLPELKEKIDQM